LVRELQRSSQLNLQPVGFLDDDPAKQKQEIYGVPVIGVLTDLGRVLDAKRVDEVLIAIPSAPGRVVRLVADVCRLKGVPFRTMPGLYELIGGKVSVSRLRDVDITDLLRREPAQIDDRLVGASLSGKRVLVTGAGGSIGRELCRQVARWGPAELVLLGHGENSIFESLLDIQPDYPSTPLHPVIADVRDAARLQAVFEAHRPQVVFHAAAHKHVPLMEINVEEAIANNVTGTRVLVETAAASGVERLVLISTDKAVRPTSVYGATKRLAEMIVLDAAHRTGRAFTVVRFGNVLGSRGSIIPIFKRQIAAGGPVTVTHPEMRRFFMTIPEAVHLVLQAAAMGQGGEVFVLNMGEQVRIVDLAEDLIRLCGNRLYRHPAGRETQRVALGRGHAFCAHPASGDLPPGRRRKGGRRLAGTRPGRTGTSLGAGRKPGNHSHPGSGHSECYGAYRAAARCDRRGLICLKSLCVNGRRFWMNAQMLTSCRRGNGAN
jgi:FlaA1/EpsC-like NDP-sugar epimerase